MRSVFTVLAVCAFLLLSNVSAGYAARSEGIAVIVNDDAITVSDVNDRMRLIVSSSGLPNTSDIRNKLMPQIIGSLVEEQIRLQEARRLNLDITPQEIEQ